LIVSEKLELSSRKSLQQIKFWKTLLHVSPKSLVLPFSIFERKDKTETLLLLFLFSCAVYLTTLS